MHCCSLKPRNRIGRVEFLFCCYNSNGRKRIRTLFLQHILRLCNVLIVLQILFSIIFVFYISNCVLFFLYKHCSLCKIIVTLDTKCCYILLSWFICDLVFVSLPQSFIFYLNCSHRILCNNHKSVWFMYSVRLYKGLIEVNKLMNTLYCGCKSDQMIYGQSF